MGKVTFKEDRKPTTNGTGAEKLDIPNETENVDIPTEKVDIPNEEEVWSKEKYEDHHQVVYRMV